MRESQNEDVNGGQLKTSRSHVNLRKIYFSFVFHQQNGRDFTLNLSHADMLCSCIAEFWLQNYADSIWDDDEYGTETFFISNLETVHVPSLQLPSNAWILTHRP